MTAIPELAQACRLHTKIVEKRNTTVEDEKECRALWLAAVVKGAAPATIQERCGISAEFLARELRKARAETTDPTLKKFRPPKGGLKLGEYWCPEVGCTRAQTNGNEPFSSVQALSLHRVSAHGYRIGKNALTAQMVRRARRDTTTPTVELAKRWDVSPFALGAARSKKTWKSVGD